MTLPFRNEPIWIGVRAMLPLVSAWAVAYADSELPNNNSMAPSTDGRRTGPPTWRQN
jgi:hypothetical protein